MVSTEKINNLGFQPSYTFEEEYRETIEWFKKMNINRISILGDSFSDTPLDGLLIIKEKF